MHMTVGPVEYIVVGFPGNKFTGEIAPELIALVESGTVRVLDLIFIGKDIDGSVLAIEIDELDDLVGFAGLDGEVGGLISPEDVAHVADLLEPNSSAALLICPGCGAGRSRTRAGVCTSTSARSRCSRSHRSAHSAGGIEGLRCAHPS
jgi:hypothetical protein